MSLLLFFVLLAISGFVFMLVYSILNFPVMGLTFLVLKASKNQRQASLLAKILLLPISLFVHLFCVLLWACAVVGKTFATVSSPDVEHPWIYWVIAFFAAPAPIQFMASKERQMDIDAEGVPNPRKERVASLWAFTAVIGFLVFAIYPPSMIKLYGWFLNWWI